MVLSFSSPPGSLELGLLTSGLVLTWFSCLLNKQVNKTRLIFYNLRKVLSNSRYGIERRNSLSCYKQPRGLSLLLPVAAFIIFYINTNCLNTSKYQYIKRGASCLWLFDVTKNAIYSSLLFFSKTKTTQISCLELMPKVFISTALITGSPPINPLSGALSETFPVVRKRYDGFDLLFFFHGHGCGLGFLEQAESFLCWNNFGGEGENPGELCYKTKNNSPALWMSSKAQFPELWLCSASFPAAWPLQNKCVDLWKRQILWMPACLPSSVIPAGIPWSIKA